MSCCVHCLLTTVFQLNVHLLKQNTVIKALLNFQKVEVTNEIIRCAAGNFNHGSKIMELLLSSENTVYGG